MTTQSSVLVTGASGIIGHAVSEELKKQGYAEVLAPSHHEMDLTSPDSINHYMRRHLPTTVIHCAALSGSADKMRSNAAAILAENVLMQTNLMKAAAELSRKFVFLGSGSVYGPQADSPFKESQAIQSIQQGSLEGYAVSKIAGICLGKQYARATGKPFISVLPTHIYGCHALDRRKEAVIDSLVVRLLEAKRDRLPEITLDIWGTGKLCKRQYLHVEDCARAIVYLLENYDGEEPVNLASEEAVSLDEVVREAQQTIGYEGAIHYLSDRPEVASARLMCMDKLKSLGFTPRYSLQSGIHQVVEAYRLMLEKK